MTSGGSMVVEHPRRGRVRARLEALERRLVPRPPPEPVIAGHPLPDLTGASPEAIADALCAAIVDAHGDDQLWATEEEEAATGHRLCPRCLTALAQASQYADPGPIQSWPDPLFVVFDRELMWREEMARWRTRPGVTFDQSVWEANEARMEAEHLHTDHYRGEIPPWVTLSDDEALATDQRGREAVS